MKFIVATVAAFTLAACMSEEAEAAEIGATGISLGAELDAAYNADAENMNITLTPEAGIEKWGWGFSAGLPVELYDDSITLWDEKPTIELDASYGMTLWGLSAELYGETGYDLEAEGWSDVVVGTRFSF